MHTAKMSDIKKTIASGGSVVFIWDACQAVLTSVNGGRVRWIDMRSYHGFLKTIASKLKRVESGSVENKDLTIQWYKETEI